MLIERNETGWAITVPAKVNLFLEVVGRRPDGYHDLDTVMLAIDLCDRLCFRPASSSKLELQIFPNEREDFHPLTPDDRAWDIPGDASNLVLRALEQVRARLSVQAGLEVQLYKGIPAQSGLGGGSADAAAAIVGGMLAWSDEYRPDIARDLAASLGSDINFFIESHPAESEQAAWLAHCTGRGERVQPILSTVAWKLVVVHPAEGCSTKEIFEGLRASGWNQDVKRTSRSIIEALEKKHLHLLPKLLYNRLGEIVLARRSGVKRIYERLINDPRVAGCCLTGSGSALVAMLNSAVQTDEFIDEIQHEENVRAYGVRGWQSPSIARQIGRRHRHSLE